MSLEDKKGAEDLRERLCPDAEQAREQVLQAVLTIEEERLRISHSPPSRSRELDDLIRGATKSQILEGELKALVEAELGQSLEPTEFEFSSLLIPAFWVFCVPEEAKVIHWVFHFQGNLQDGFYGIGIHPGPFIHLNGKDNVGDWERDHFRENLEGSSSTEGNVESLKKSSLQDDFLESSVVQSTFYPGSPARLLVRVGDSRIYSHCFFESDKHSLVYLFLPSDSAILPGSFY